MKKKITGNILIWMIRIVVLSIASIPVIGIGYLLYKYNILFFGNIFDGIVWLVMQLYNTGLLALLIGIIVLFFLIIYLAIILVLKIKEWMR